MGPCTTNARRSTVEIRCRGTTINCCLADLRRCLPTTSVTGVQQSVRYCGALPCLHFSFLWRYLQARWPNQQCQSTEGNQLVVEITITTPPCCNNTTLRNCLYAQRKVPMWQTQSVGPIRTAHISVLLTVNIVSHNPAQSSSDNITY